MANSNCFTSPLSLALCNANGGSLFASGKNNDEIIKELGQMSLKKLNYGRKKRRRRYKRSKKKSFIL